MESFPLTIWERPRTQAIFRPTAIKTPCAKVTNYNDKDIDTIVIACAIVEEQFNPIEEFPNLFFKNILRELLPLQEVTYCMDLKPGSE